MSARRRSSRDNQADTYNRVLGLAQAAGDQDVASRLEVMGPPPCAAIDREPLSAGQTFSG
jgi:hypothetical protein